MAREVTLPSHNFEDKDRKELKRASDISSSKDRLEKLFRRH